VHILLHTSSYWGELSLQLKASGTWEITESNATCSTALYAGEPFSLPLGFLAANASGMMTENDPWRGIGRIVTSVCVLKVLAPVAFLSTVRAEDLPLVAPPTLLLKWFYQSVYHWGLVRLDSPIGVLEEMSAWQNALSAKIIFWPDELKIPLLTGGTKFYGSGMSSQDLRGDPRILEF
jgi:hypothetical protein